VATAGRRATRYGWTASWTERWTEWFGPELLNESDETVLVGLIADQSALHGVLDKVRDMVLSVIDMRRLPSEDWTRKAAGMKRMRIQRSKGRTERWWLEVFPTDPRDTDVVRAKAIDRGWADDRRIGSGTCRR
jgi:hypothetical protein